MWIFDIDGYWIFMDIGYLWIFGGLKYSGNTVEIWPKAEI